LKGGKIYYNSSICFGYMSSTELREIPQTRIHGGNSLLPHP
jgi:hypothetical protein